MRFKSAGILLVDIRLPHYTSLFGSCDFWESSIHFQFTHVAVHISIPLAVKLCLHVTMSVYLRGGETNDEMKAWFSVGTLI